MKALLKAGGAILVCLVLLLVVLSITGFEPHDRRPGLWLKGGLVTTPVNDWCFAYKYPTAMLQTNAWYLLPHSVTVNFTPYNGQLYLASFYYREGVEYPHGRSWNEDVARDPHVRIKIGDQLYDRTLSYVTDPAEKAGMLEAFAKKYPNLKIPATVHVFRVIG